MTRRRGSRSLDDHDALILLAVSSPSDEPRDLSQVIGAVDYINHSIPTREELEGALTRLNAAGLIRARKAGYVITERTRELLDKVRQTCRRATRSQLRGLAALLDCPCCGVRFNKPRRVLTITPADYDAALAAYRERFRHA